VGETVRRDADDGGELFRDAVRGATPLADRRRVPVRPRSTAAGTIRKEQAVAAVSSAPALKREGSGGRASGVSRTTLRDLAAGRPACEARLDLHRNTSRVAQERLTRFVATSRAARLRVILVITGKGERSIGPDRLRDLVPDWLCGPLAPSILAFTAARAEHGGTGALYVLLRTSAP
jgi:DNA-nicking Smr family endonuclease